MQKKDYDAIAGVFKTMYNVLDHDSLSEEEFMIASRYLKETQDKMEIALLKNDSKFDHLKFEAGCINVKLCGNIK